MEQLGPDWMNFDKMWYTKHGIIKLTYRFDTVNTDGNIIII